MININIRLNTETDKMSEAFDISFIRSGYIKQEIINSILSLLEEDETETTKEIPHIGAYADIELSTLAVFKRTLQKMENDNEVLYLAYNFARLYISAHSLVKSFLVVENLRMVMEGESSEKTSPKDIRIKLCRRLRTEYNKILKEILPNAEN